MSQCHVMRCLAGMCYAPAPSHHRLLPRANSCFALHPNPTSHTTPCFLTVNIPLLHCLATMIPAPEIIHTSAFPHGRDYLCQLSLRHPTSESLPTFHPLPTRFPSLSPSTFHPFVVSTLALSNSSHVSFHGVRTKTFSTHVTT